MRKLSVCWWNQKNSFLFAFEIRKLFLGGGGASGMRKIGFFGFWIPFVFAYGMRLNRFFLFWGFRKLAFFVWEREKLDILLLEWKKRFSFVDSENCCFLLLDWQKLKFTVFRLPKTVENRSQKPLGCFVKRPKNRKFHH